ncbi:glycosyltransferase family 2 protein [Duganella sp. Root336D2]|uniref:glycosyltransferase family 2 protein n=1 Tax=Duganella sp. Root336D2 TaxID=1736518 RepID=UPI0006F3258E|nr:glycosyltransferase family 2 protein [Duganella sp. Root336D2]KQV44857.1 glycosyl transferase family 2 [Duganella sp. Root336D2]
MQDDDTLPKVAILLCTYHGQHFLADQLDSIERQTHPNWEVWASDDGSEDDTHAILERYQGKWGAQRISIHNGPAEGFVSNFLSLTCKADIEADYYAFSDQDDIWEADKLQRGLEWLRNVSKDVPALYCSRTRLVDAENRELGLSPLFAKPPSFANALIQNIGGANTMIFNDAARRLLREAGENIEVVSHDSWAYMVVTGCGGKVKYDAYPTLRYRQHDNNVVGMNTTWAARRTRIRMLWQGHLSTWNERHLIALQRLQPRLTPESRHTLELLARARKRSLVPRLIDLKKSGIHRQTLLGNLGLLAAAIFKKI